MAATPEWPQFRGPGGLGVADASSLPERWSGTTNVAWRIDIPGRGWSSPIVWRGRVFVTTAVSAGAFKAPSTGIFGNDYAAELERQGLSEEEIVKKRGRPRHRAHQRVGRDQLQVLAIDAKSGKVAVDAAGAPRRPAGGRHRKNTYASETPVTDGERLYASFGGNVGLFCYTFDGELLWQRQWSRSRSISTSAPPRRPSSTTDASISCTTTTAQSFLAALDAKTGARAVEGRRAPTPPSSSRAGRRRSSGRNDGRTEIVTIGRGFVVSYDVDGKERWRLRGMPQATPSPVAADGLLYVGSGSQGEARRPLMAIRPGAEGDISLGKGRDEQRVRRLVAAAFRRLHAVAAGVSRPHLRGQRQRHSAGGRRRKPASRSSRRASAAADTLLELADGEPGPHLSGSARTATPSSFGAGDRYEELAHNTLDEMSLATPAADADGLYLRTQTKLYRIRNAGG